MSEVRILSPRPRSKMERYKRREQKLEARRRRIKKHGKNIGEIYRNALERRISKGDR